MRTWRRWRFVRELHAGPVVEFAIIVPVLLLIVFGVVDLAWAFNRRSALVTASREAARFAAVLRDPCSSVDQVKARLNSRLTGDTIPWANITFLAPGTATTGCTVVTDSVVVRVTNAPYRAITPFFSLLRRAVNLRASAVFRWERS